MMFLLQTNFQWKETDPVTGIIAVVIFGAFILFLVIANNASGAGKTGSGGNSRGTKRGFRLNARKIGLSRPQLRTLENLAKRHNAGNLNNLLSSSAQLDNLLKKAIQSINGQSSSDAQKETQKLQLYRIKQLIERNATRKKVFTGTKQLIAGTRIVLTPEGGGRYQSKILTNLKGVLAVSVPADNAGSQLRWKRWSKVNAFFWKSNGQGFSFSTKVNGYGKVRTFDALLLNHSNHIVQAQQRRFRRRSIERPTYFYPVRILTDGIGKNVKKRAIVENRRGTLATMLDISAGGCSIRSINPLTAGELIKVDFETEANAAVSFYGKVINTRKAHPHGGIMHIRFTRISKQNLNSINAYVYNYQDE